MQDMMKILFGVLFLTFMTGCISNRTAGVDEQVDMLTFRVESHEAYIDSLSRELLEKEGKYMLRAGDTLSLISKKFNVEISDIFHLNPDLDRGHLETWKPGMIIKIRDLPNQSIRPAPQ